MKKILYILFDPISNSHQIITQEDGNILKYPLTSIKDFNVFAKNYEGNLTLPQVPVKINGTIY